MSQYTMLIDTTRCIGCKACAVACQQENGLDGENRRLRVWQREYLTDHFVSYYYPQSCRHCFVPACQDICPVGAIQRRKDGLVLQDETKCIGCGACITTCSYGGVRVMSNGITGKCSFCEHLITRGKQPACVSVCPAEARIFGQREVILNETKQRLENLKRTGLKVEMEGEIDPKSAVIYLFQR